MPNSMGTVWNSVLRDCLAPGALFVGALLASQTGCNPADSPEGSSTSSSGAQAETSQGTSDSANPLASTPPARPMTPEEIEQSVLRDTLHTAELEAVGKYDEALDVWKGILERLAKLHGDDSWQYRTAQLSAELQRRRSQFSISDRTLLVNIADWERRGDRFASLGQAFEALGAYQEALTISSQIWGDDCPITLTLRRKLGNQQELSGDPQNAMTSYLAVINGRTTVFGELHPYTLDAIGDLARLHQHAGRFDLAVQQASKRLQGVEQVFGAQSAEVAQARNDLGAIYLAASDWPRAEREFNAALAARRKLFPSTSPIIAHSLRNLALGYMAQKDWAEAHELLTEAITISQAAQQSEDTTELQLKRGSCALAMEDLTGAEADFTAARESLEQVQDLSPVLFADACFKEAYAIGRQGRYQESLPLVEKAFSIQQRHLAADDPAMLQTTQLRNLVLSKLDAVRVGGESPTIR